LKWDSLDQTQLSYNKIIRRKISADNNKYSHGNLNKAVFWINVSCSKVSVSN
uniref:Transposase n=1 Tax=Schistosoma curassoni TaxID=6186 RepID=A0A183JLZ3_9TREM